MNPYKDLQVTDFYIIREFSQDIYPIELLWHRDKEDRIVESLKETDWQIQLENNLPIRINNPIFIPRGLYHRVIKGSGNIVLKIIKK
jgi:hypothetical protein